MRGCAFCGRVAFGGQHSLHRSNYRTVLVPPGAIPNAVQANPVALWQLANAGQDKFYCCKVCKHSRARVLKSHYHKLATTAELKALELIYSLHAGLPLLLGVIKCGVRIASRINGFLITEPTTSMPLIDGPIISFDCTSGYEPQEMAEMVGDALQQQRQLGNPVIGQHLTVLERAVGPSARCTAAGTTSTARLEEDDHTVAGCSHHHRQHSNNGATSSESAAVEDLAQASDCGSGDFNCEGAADVTEDCTVQPGYAVPVLPATTAEHITL